MSLPARNVGQLALTEYGFGTAGIAPLPHDDALATMQAAWDGGIRYFDTAPRYGGGAAEAHLGAFLDGRSGAVVSTKVGRILTDEGEVTDFSADGIMRSFEASLKRLGCDRVDIVYVHDIGRMVQGVEHEARRSELMNNGRRALDRLKAEGLTRAVGLGVNEVEICLDLLNEMDLDAILLAGRYTLLDRSAEADLLPALEGCDTKLVVGGILNSGILLPGGPETFDYGPAPVHVVHAARAVAKHVEKAGVSLTALAANFPLTHPCVASVLIGTTDPDTTREAVAHHGEAVDPALLAAIAPHTLSATPR